MYIRLKALGKQGMILMQREMTGSQRKNELEKKMWKWNMMTLMEVKMKMKFMIH